MKWATTKRFPQCKWCLWLCISHVVRHSTWHLSGLYNSLPLVTLGNAITLYLGQYCAQNMQTRVWVITAFLLCAVWVRELNNVFIRGFKLLLIEENSTRHTYSNMSAVVGSDYFGVADIAANHASLLATSLSDVPSRQFNFANRYSTSGMVVTKDGWNFPDPLANFTFKKRSFGLSWSIRGQGLHIGPQTWFSTCFQMKYRKYLYYYFDLIFMALKW